MRFFAAETVRQSPSWTKSTIPAPIVAEGSGSRRYWRAWRNAARLSRATTADDIVNFMDDHPVTANLFGLRLRLRRHRPTLTRCDPLLHFPRSSLRRRYIQAAFAAIDRIMVWAPDVARRYHEQYAIPLEKMVAVKFHHTLLGHAPPKVACGDYIFSGGNSMRDYAMLIEALRGSTVPVRIASVWKPPATLQVPDHIIIRQTTDTEFREWLAGAKFVVLPLQMDDLRTSGQQSYLNAMALGKTVVVTDALDAPFYIDNNRTGIVTPAGDTAALRQAIQTLLDNPETIRTIGDAARAEALPLDQEATWSKVLAISLEAHAQRTNR